MGLAVALCGPLACYLSAAAASRSGLVVMGGGIKQPRPASPPDPSQLPAPVAPSLAAGASLPRLVVFDLDNTLWTPELYTLRHLAGYERAAPPNPRAWQDVWLLDGAVAALHELATCQAWSETKLGLASRTNKGGWARALLSQFTVPGESSASAPRSGGRSAGCGRTLSEFFVHKQIYTGDKKRHFEALHEESGIAYEEMLFFDDAAGGKYGNCEPVASLGVLAAHCPDGLTYDVRAKKT